MNKILASLALAGALTAGIASAQTTFTAILTGAGENPPNASTATGSGTLVLNAAATQFTIDASFSGLMSPATAGHIHGPGGVGPGGATNANVIFPFTGVPAATSGAIPQQSFAINATQLGYLFSGYLYVNFHNTNFPGGEIRGQLIQVPEPNVLALCGVCGLGMAAMAWRARRRSQE
jgi:hypothetical protein